MTARLGDAAAANAEMPAARRAALRARRRKQFGHTGAVEAHAFAGQGEGEIARSLGGLGNAITAGAEPNDLEYLLNRHAPLRSGTPDCPSRRGSARG
jgi:hypothetical protein